MSIVQTGFNAAAGNQTSEIQTQRFGGDLETIVPSDLLFSKPQRGVPILRSFVKIRAQQSSYISNGNNEIIIRMPNDSFYDARRGFISFDVQITTTGGTYRRLAEGVWSMFYRNKTLLGFEMENIVEYNRLFSLLWEAKNDERQSSNLAKGLMGIGTPAERNGFGTVVQHYAMPYLSGFFDTEILPFNMMNVICEIRLTLDDASKFVETDGTVPIVTITNVMFHAERISASSRFVSMMMSKIQSSGLTLGFPTYNYYSQAVAAGSQNLNTLTINHKTASLYHIIQIWTNQNTVNSTTTNDKFVTYPKLTYQHQFKLNNAFIPEEPVVYTDQFAAEAYFNYINWLTKKWYLSGDLQGTPAPIQVNDFSNGDKFILIVDVNGYPLDPDVINPVGNENDSIQMQLDLYITNPLPVPYRSDFFVCYHRQINISPKGVVAVTF